MAPEVGISVLMTTYNRERYVKDAICSVLQSSFTDFELIVVDDGSKDQTISIVKAMAAQDSRIQLHKNPSNLGDYPNRNRAASLAKGKYLKYVDADDLIYPWGLEVLWESMEKFPNAGWGLCSLAQDRSRIFPFALNPAEAYRYHYLGPRLFHKAPLSSIIRKTLFDEVGGFEPQRMVGDFEMWHRLAKISPVVLMPQGMVWYRFHDQQESNELHAFTDHYQKIERRHLTAPDAPLSQDELNEIYSLKVKLGRKELLLALAKANFPQARSSLKQLRALKPFIKRTT
jgi:glycosyltransferase involved in cell wall biosynthesis